MAYKVCVCGGAGGIGQPLSMLMAMDDRVGTLCVQDVNMSAVPAAGVAADLSHIEALADVKPFSIDPNKPSIDQLEECLTGCHMVLVPAGIPRKPGMTRDDLFLTNCKIAQGIIDACAKFCPTAMILLIVNPVNSVVPAMAELYKAKGLDPMKIVGITTLDIVRANKFLGRELGVKPSTVNVPVVGGHAGATILPLISQTGGKDLSLDKIKALDKRIQEAGTEVVQAKSGKGSATLSMAYAGARLAKSILSGWEGQSVEEYSYVANDICGLPYFASKVTYGKNGIEKVHPLGVLSDYEKGRLDEVVKQLREEIGKGVQYAFSQIMNEGGIFMGVKEAPPDPIFGTTQLFNADAAPEKINLGSGIYKTSEGKPYVPPVIAKAEELLTADRKEGKINKEYASIDGPVRLKELTQALVFGSDAAAVKEGRIASTQAVSGTGALTVAAEFIKKFMPAACHTIFVSDPTWVNHNSIFERAGLTVRSYPYWKPEERALDFDGMIAALTNAPIGAAVLLHACAHNPTGLDPTEAQWSQIIDTLLQRQLVPMVDSAYQGYASGSLEKDAFACRLLENRGLEMFVCQSLSKNLAVYGERIGMVHAVCADAERAKCVLSQLKMVIRPMYSSPPIHGAHLAMKVLGEPALYEQWRVELKAMSDRILEVRAKLRKGLEDKGTPGTWSHVTDQVGLFSYTGLTKEVCERLIEKHHIYLDKSGRISLGGLSSNNLEHMIQAVDESVRALSAAPPAPPAPAPAASTTGGTAYPSGSVGEPAAVAGSATEAARALSSGTGPGSSASVFADIKEAPPDPILGTTLLFNEDTAPEKINLGVGAYRDNDGKPYILPIVAKAEDALVEDIKSGAVGKEYSPIDGPQKLKEVTQMVLFGKEAASIKNGCIASVQTLSGTGSLRVIGDFAKKNLPAACHTIYVSNPTWGNHNAIFACSGLEVKNYTYYKDETRSLDFDAMVNALKEVPTGSCIVLHACAHNPTGVDPTEEQWQKIADLVAERQLVPLMDIAYQGYASGSLDKDGYAVRLFESKGIEMFVCQSFAKTLGLYGERIGMAHVVCRDADKAKRVLSQLKVVIRAMYSSPPIHGGHLVARILEDDANFEQWKAELKEMADRILSVRAKLRKGLEDKGTPGTWNHVTDQIGMFSYTGLTAKACETLISKHHIYLLKSGRISLAGLNDKNLEHMIQSVDDAVRSSS